MRSLEANEWVFLSSLIFGIEETADEEAMRREFLSRLANVVDYDSADFYLIKETKGEKSVLQGWNRGVTQDRQPGGHLQPREETVLRLMMDGLENGEIAEKLSISVNTLKKHILSIYRKIGVRDRIGLFKAIREKEV